MSDNLARVLPNRRNDSETSPADARRHIEIVSPRAERHARPRIIYALTAVTGVAAIVVAQLLVSVGISQGAYEISSLQASQVELGRTAESVREELIRASSPQSLAANAEALGMVGNSNPVYLRLSDGAVLGVPSSASGEQGAAAGLVPNVLLADVPLVTQLPPAGALGTGVGASAAHTSAAAPSAAVSPATSPAASSAATPAAPVANTLPSPATR